MTNPYTTFDNSSCTASKDNRVYSEYAAACDTGDQEISKSEYDRRIALRDPIYCFTPTHNQFYETRNFEVCSPSYHKITKEEYERRKSGSSAKVSTKTTIPVPSKAKERTTDDKTEVVFWQSIKDSNNPAMFREYLKQFPGGTFAGVARLKIEELGKRQAALTVPPRPAPQAEPVVGVYPKALKPGESFKDCDDCPEMVVIPAGTFMMGSPTSEEGRSKDEGPQHRVSVS